MNDKSNPGPSLSDDQVENLLSAFYQSEIPPELDQPPSTWPQIADSAPVTATPAPRPAAVRPGSSAGRGLAVAITTLAACLMVMVFSQSAPNNDTAENKPDVSLDNPGTVNVSADGDARSDGGTARDDDTSWEEVLNSEAPQTPKERPKQSGNSEPK